MKMKTVALLVLAAFVCASCGPSLAKRKEESGIHYRTGVVHLNDKNLTEALKELTAAVEMYDKDPSYHNALGLAYFARGMNADAIKELKSAVDLDMKFSEAHVNLAAVYSVERRWDDVITESQAALKNIFYKTPELAYFNMGWAYYNKADYKTAFESFKKSVQLNPDYAQAYYHLGLTLDKSGDAKNSVDSFDKAIKIQANYPEAYYALGLAYVKLKDKPAATKAFQKVIELSPQGDLAAPAKDYLNLIK